MFRLLIWSGFLFWVRASQFTDPHCSNGRSTITHLFEWKWSDIAEECERFLAPHGYCGVQISPPNENRIVTEPNRPWWERYQPVSYKLETRSGNEQQFKNMVERCNTVGVRIYADAVINHMTGVGGTGYGTGGTRYDANILQYPGVPFGGNDFNGASECPTHDLNIHNYNNVNEVRNCRLVSLADLKLSANYVRERIAGFLNNLIDIGVAGIRLDATKHMWPGDVSAVLSKTKDLRPDIFGSGKKLFVFQEVIDLGNEPIKADEYVQTGKVTNFKYGIELGKLFRKQNPLKYLSNFGEGWGMMDGHYAVNFIDNHDNQRGHGGGGSVLTHWEPRPYKMATAFMLAHPYGFPRIMSSYEFDRQYDWIGPPHNGDMSIKDVIINSDKTCGNGWSCEHRWRQIYNMVAFRNSAGFEGLTNWWAGSDYQIAFSRGSKAFIAFNLEDWDLNSTLNTGMLPGTYCDVISGGLVNGACTGRSVHVSSGGDANIHISNTWEDPMIAIHVGRYIFSMDTWLCRFVRS